ncbi:MAG: response regulator transcription factor, partial [Thiomicrospira sp.]|nr:response regulator transcription factor [Thiomicrospira sp.]
RLKLTASGEPALSPTIARKIIKHFERSHLSQPSHNLTNREQEVLIFIAKGLTSKEVASLLEISNYTVKEYIKNICNYSPPPQLINLMKGDVIRHKS